MNTTHDAAAQEHLDSLASPQEFCKDWEGKWRGIAVAAQSFLRLPFPLAASVIGFLITVADSFCPAQ